MRSTVDLINISPLISLQSNMPEKVWIEKDILYDHFRVFGSRAFIHILKEERFKLDRKSK